MKKTVTIVLSMLISAGSFAQEIDTKAKGILDKLSATTKAHKTIQATFNFTLNNKSEDINESQSGEILIKGDHYFLSISGQDVMSDGKAIYTVLKDAEEVQINNVPKESEEQYLSPNTIFTMYETGFKYSYLKEDKGMHIINLYPKAADEKDFHRIALFINKEKNQISKINIFGKDGSKTTYNITSFTANVAIPASKFTFDPAKNSNYEVVDLRD
jgi:outer membrane lipoprotein carrier protein